MTRASDDRPTPPTDQPLRPPVPLPTRLNRNVLTVAAALAGVTVLTVLVLSSSARGRRVGDGKALPPESSAPGVPARPSFLDLPTAVAPADRGRVGTDPAVAGVTAPRPGEGIGSVARGGDDLERQRSFAAARTSSVLIRDAADAVGRQSIPPRQGLPVPSGAILGGVDTPAPAGPIVLHIDSTAPSVPILADPVERGAAGPFGLRAGTIISGYLLSGIDSDLPGAIVGQTSRDVFDSDTQRILLIPKGSKLVGSYDNQNVHTGRLLVTWRRVLFPDGRSITLPTSMTADESGAAGMHDRVDHHYPRIFGTALLVSALTAGMQLSQAQQETVFGLPSAGQVAAGAFGQQLGQVGIESARRGLDTPPTITIRPGQPFDILLIQDIAFDGPYTVAP
jgi:hypothetical protein